MPETVTSEDVVSIDLEAIAAEISNMDLEQIKRELIEAKAKQRIASKKYYNPESAKRARLKRTEKLKAMEQFLENQGLMDEVQDAVDAAVAEADV